MCLNICVTCFRGASFFTHGGPAYVKTIGCKEDIALQGSKCSLAASPEAGDLLQGSSLEVSPSNSSGGTYMWDEEGLEALCGAGTHPSDSYDDSELNSMVRRTHLTMLFICTCWVMFYRVGC